MIIKEEQFQHGGQKEKERVDVSFLKKIGVQITRKMVEDLVKTSPNKTESSNKDDILATAYELLHDAKNTRPICRKVESNKRVIRTKSM